MCWCAWGTSSYPSYGAEGAAGEKKALLSIQGWSVSSSGLGVQIWGKNEGPPIYMASMYSDWQYPRLLVYKASEYPLTLPSSQEMTGVHLAEFGLQHFPLTQLAKVKAQSDPFSSCLLVSVHSETLVSLHLSVKTRPKALFYYI